MTDREKAIVMAHTGICMLEGEKMGEFYQYLRELYGRPVYTHEWLTLDIKERSKPDFLRLCKEEEPELKKGKWIRHDEVRNVYGGTCVECSECGEKYVVSHIEDEKWCRNCGARLEGKKE